MEPGTKLVEWYLKEGSIYGIAVVFLVCVLLLLLYVAIATVSVIKKWLPLWFEKNIESHDKVCKALDSFCERLDITHSVASATHGGVHGALRAVNHHLSDKGNQERLGIRSDVIFQLKAAERSMRNTVRKEEDVDETKSC